MLKLIGTLHLCDRWAARELGALLALGRGFIRSALLTDDSTIFSQKSIQKSPATLASLSKIVTAQHLLHREAAWISPKHLKSTLHHLDKGHSVAGTTTFLVSHFACEVIAINVTEVPLNRDVLIVDFFLREGCNFGQSWFEKITTFTERNLDEILLLGALAAVMVLVSFCQETGACLPRQIFWIDLRNEEIHFLRRFLLVELCELLFGHKKATESIKRPLIYGSVTYIFVIILCVWLFDLRFSKHLLFLYLFLRGWLVHDAIEALDLVFWERLWGSDLLDKSYHCFVTMFIESFKIMISNCLKVSKVLLVSWLICYLPRNLLKVYDFKILALFNCVLEICNEPKAW